MCLYPDTCFVQAWSIGRHGSGTGYVEHVPVQANAESAVVGGSK